MVLNSDLEVSVPPQIFKLYDIRGVAHDTLTRRSMSLIGQSFGSECVEKREREVFVARDARHSGHELTQALIQGVRSAGVDVIDLGTVPTPLMYFAAHHSSGGTGLMVTASHNPPEYNGVKMMLAHDVLYGESIQKLYRRIIQGPLIEQSDGGLSEGSVVDAYRDAVRRDIGVERSLKVVLDCANGVGGVIAPRVIRDIGCEVIELYCDVDGSFPNHPGDPTKTENLQDLISTVIENQADVGIALDGDGDRLVAVSPQGEIIWPDRLMILFVREIIASNPGRKVVFDVKCARALADEIVRAGGEPVMWKTGHSLTRTKLKECNGIFGGEMSGHLYFRDRWPGFDDGIYASARLCELLAASHLSATEVFQSLPSSESTPEIRIPCESPHDLVERFKQTAVFDNAKSSELDGLRVEFADGFGLIRASNTASEIVLRFDADSKAGLGRIQDSFIEVLNSLIDLQHSDFEAPG